jgi:hypothetical protein
VAASAVSERQYRKRWADQRTISKRFVTAAIASPTISFRVEAKVICSGEKRRSVKSSRDRQAMSPRETDLGPVVVNAVQGEVQALHGQSVAEGASPGPELGLEYLARDLFCGPLLAEAHLDGVAREVLMGTHTKERRQRVGSPAGSRERTD